MDYKTPLTNEPSTEQDAVVTQLRNYILEHNLQPGDKLPAERKLSEHLQVSRNMVREAIRKLEFFGLLKTLPQSGTIISSLGVAAMDGMITDALKLEQPDFRALVESRIILESNAVGLAALRRSTRHLARIEEALDAYAEKASQGLNAVEEDLEFHLRIAEASGNTVINTLMLIVTPEIIRNFEKYHVCDKKQTVQGIKEHQNIYDAIVQKDMDLARIQLKRHFSNLYQYCYTDHDIKDFSKLTIDH